MRRVAIAAAVSIATVAAAAIVARPVPVSAFDTRIRDQQILRAIELGRSDDEASIARFNDRYIIPIGDPTFVSLEIVTEFRRIVLESQISTRRRSGWGVREASEVLEPYRGTVTLTLHVALPPQNVYRSMPPFGLVVYPQGASADERRLEPRDVRVVPQYVSRQLAPPGSPILGGLIEATFPADRLDPHGICLVGIIDGGRERRRVEVNFGGIE